MKGAQITDATYNYILKHFSAEDDFLATLNSDARAKDIPAIQVAPEQLAFMQVLLQGMGAKYVLEIGSLAGYSAIGMARALPAGGKVVAFELNADYAQFIRQKAADAGVADKVEVHVGDAKKVLQDFRSDCEFDFVFIDADKSGYVEYLHLVLPLVRVGGIIAGDNTLAWGRIAEENTDDNSVHGLQAFNKAISAHPQLQTCLVPIGDGMTMGVKLPQP